MNSELEQEVREMFMIKDNWYHKIPYIGNLILKKQKYKLWTINKFRMFEILEQEMEKSFDEELKNLTCETTKNFIINKEYKTIEENNLVKYKSICKQIQIKT